MPSMWQRQSDSQFGPLTEVSHKEKKQVTVTMPTVLSHRCPSEEDSASSDYGTSDMADEKTIPFLRYADS
jgi:hypothetical protein